MDKKASPYGLLAVVRKFNTFDSALAENKQNTWSCLPTTEGKTSPGQSHNLTLGVRKMVWKCLV